MERRCVLPAFCLLALLVLLAASGPAWAKESSGPASPVTAAVSPGCTPAVAAWTVERVDAQKDFANQGGRTVVLDTSGYAHAVYGGDHLYYARYNGTTWQRETVDAAVGTGAYASLALDSADHPHISYYDQVKQDTKYAYFDGTTWQIQTVDANVSSA